MDLITQLRVYYPTSHSRFQLDQLCECCLRTVLGSAELLELLAWLPCSVYGDVQSYEYPIGIGEGDGFYHICSIVWHVVCQLHCK